MMAILHLEAKQVYHLLDLTTRQNRQNQRQVNLETIELRPSCLFHIAL
jgi:hypothetical protein